jgi:hypothetical protein
MAIFESVAMANAPYSRVGTLSFYTGNQITVILRPHLIVEMNFGKIADLSEAECAEGSIQVAPNPPCSLYSSRILSGLLRLGRFRVNRF